MSLHLSFAFILSLGGSALVLSELALAVGDLEFFLQASIPVLIVLISGILLYVRPKRHKPLGAVILAFSIAIFFLLIFILPPPPEFTHTSNAYGLASTLFQIGPMISGAGGFLGIIWRPLEQTRPTK